MKGNNIKYEHTQIGYLIVYVLLIMIPFFSFILMQADHNLLIFAFMVFILFILASFTLLKVAIYDDYLRIKFGYGIFWKRFLLKEIISVKQVRNHWCYGWGIRLWLWPVMVIFNVSGFDAVEIKMRNEKIYRIGTDEPEKLEAAIKREM